MGPADWKSKWTVRDVLKDLDPPTGIAQELLAVAGGNKDVFICDIDAKMPPHVRASVEHSFWQYWRD